MEENNYNEKIKDIVGSIKDTENKIFGNNEK